MGKYVGYLIIFSIYLLFKGCDYASLEKTTGVVISYGTFKYGSVYGRRAWAGSKDVVPYPIAKFIGPVRTKMVVTPIYKPEESEPNTTPPAKIYDTVYTESAEYITKIPWGSYYFRHYHIGDKVPIVYSPYNPEDGMVCTVFSYWLSLPAICAMIFICLVWTGIYNVKTRRYGE